MVDKPSLLIVDDDPLITETLAYALGKDFDVLVSGSRSHAVGLVRGLDTPPQLALVDLGLPPVPHRPDEGFQLVAELLACSPAMKKPRPTDHDRTRAPQFHHQLRAAAPVGARRAASGTRA